MLDLQSSSLQEVCLSCENAVLISWLAVNRRCLSCVIHMIFYVFLSVYKKKKLKIRICTHEQQFYTSLLEIYHLLLV